MLPRTAAPRAARSLLLGLLGLLLLLAAPGARGQAAPGAEPGTSPVEAPAGYPDPRRAGLTAAIPECGVVTVSSDRCDFRRLNSGLDRMQLHRPIVNIVNVLGAAAMTRVPQAYNGLRQVLRNTFAANPAKPVSYLEAPAATVSVQPRNGGPPVTATGSLSTSIEKSVQAQGGKNNFRYKLQLQRGGDGNRFGELPPGKCQVVIYGPCTCPAPPTPPPPPPPSTSCSYTDETCAEGTVCPAGTAVSAECADPAENGNPCACTALQQLAALKASVASELPWSDLANNNYCITDFGAPINVFCEEVSGVNLPLRVTAFQAGLNGEMPTSVGDLGPSMRTLNLESNFINSVATEIGALTDMLDLNMRDNFLASLPAEIGDLTDLTLLDLSFNALTSLPTEIGLMRSLFTLTVTTNLLTAVPTEIGALTSLNFLRLGANELTAVPTEIGALANLVKLELGFNSLETVPSEMAALTLDTLNLEANNLIDVPEEFRNVSPGSECKFNGNPVSILRPDFSCANLGAGTSCCTIRNCGDTATCYDAGP